MSFSRPSTRLRRLAASTGALALAGALALSGVAGGGVEMTEAAWNDSEVAQASVTATWPTSSWAKQTTSSYTNFRSFSERVNEYSWDLSNRIDSPTSGTSTVNWTDTYGNVRGATPNFGPYSGVEDDKNNSMRGCAQAAPIFSSLTSDVTGCTGGTSYQLSNTQVRARGYGRSSAFANPSTNAETPISWIIADDVRTSAECHADGTSVAGAPSAGGSSKGFIRLRASSNLLGGVSNSNDKLIVPSDNSRIVGWVQPKDWSSGNLLDAYWRYTVTSRAIRGPGWALSDLTVSVDVFRISTPKYLGTFQSVMSRSECAVNAPGRSREPSTPTFTERIEPSFPGTPLPKEVTTPINLNTGQAISVGDRAVLRGMPGANTLPAEALPITTATSPLENTTASETTTSAPPNPSGADEPPTAGTSTAEATASTTRRTSMAPTVSAAPTSATTPPATPATTSTSAAPSTVIPDEPGTLSPAARIDDVGIVEVDGEDLVVVVKGDELPADARTALTSLDRWLNDGVEPSGAWKAFTSDDPERDGWRWAAINQKTGTVVYIR